MKRYRGSWILQNNPEEIRFTEYKVEFSTRDPEKLEKYMGSEDEWKSAENALAKALER